MTTSTCTPKFSCRLDAEWAHLRTSRRALRIARHWSAAVRAEPFHTLVAEVDDLEAIVAATQRDAASMSDGDGILLHLVDLARTDELAGRIVVQRLLPALISRTERYAPFHRSVDPIEIVVAAAWLAVSAYDTERRRRNVASSLLSDAIYGAFRQPLRRRSATETVRPIGDFVSMPSEEAETTAFEQLADVVRTARRAGVPTHDLDLVRQLVQTGSPGVVARQRCVTPRTIRNHRDRAIVNIRQALDVAA